MKISKYLISLSVVGSAIGFYVYYKDGQGGPRYIKNVTASGKTIIITGACSGIGKATALDLAKRGGRVIMACRDMVNCEIVKKEIIDATFNTNVVCRKLDLASLQSIRDFAAETNKIEKRIDVLINNAGVMEYTKKYTNEGFEKQLGVNYLGHFLLSNLLLKKIISSKPSRIVNVTCAGYSTAALDFTDLNSDNNFNNNNAFKVSKLAVVLFTIDLAKELEGKEVTVNVVNPGVVHTNIRRNFPNNDSFIFTYLLKPLWSLILMDPTKAAHTLIFAAIDPTISNITGKMLMECDIYPIDPKVFNEHNIKKLKLTSEKWTRLI